MEISEDHIDAIGEYINIGIGKAAQILNDMLETHIELSIPQVKIVSKKDFENEFHGDLATVRLSFSGDLTGKAVLIFLPKSAIQLVCALTDEPQESPDIDALKGETLNEVGNILINGIMGSLANMTKQSIEYTIPIYREDTVHQLIDALKIEDGNNVLLVKSAFDIAEKNVDGNVVVFFDVQSLRNILELVDHILND